MKNIKFQIPFRTGDVVALTEEGAVEWSWSATEAGEHMVVAKVSQNEGSGEFSYATIKAAWFNHSHLVLVRGADQESLRTLFDSYEDEDDEDDLTIDVG